MRMRSRRRRRRGGGHRRLSYEVSAEQRHQHADDEHRAAPSDRVHEIYPDSANVNGSTMGAPAFRSARAHIAIVQPLST